jgi:hypothetical protein
MRLSGALAAAVALAGLLVCGRARAWQEAHETHDDARVVIDAAGMAQVEHRIGWHVVRGPLRFFDVVNVPASAALEPDVLIATEDGRSLLGHAARHDGRTVRVTVDEPRALMRGNVTFEVRWQVDLVASRALVRDGATWRLVWAAPVAVDGFDGARTVFDFPAAPDAPRPVVAETGALDEAAVATTRREDGRDVLELIRPHVARGEAAVWNVRIDPRALGQLVDPRLRASHEVSAPAEPDRIREASLAVGLSALASLVGLLVLRKARQFGAACAARGATARALVPLPDRWRAGAAGLAVAAGVACELAGRATAAAVCVGVATLAAALRAPCARAAARGPGRWLALRPEDAFVAEAPMTKWEGLAVLGTAGLVVGAAFAVRRLDAAAPWLVVLDAAPLVSLWITGRASQLPPDGARTAAPWLARAFRSLRALPELRARPWARVPLRGDTPDELRLLVLPRVAIPGVLGVEVGIAWARTPVGWAPVPEVLARVLEGSPAAAKLACDFPVSRSVPGRRPDERVTRLLPAAPTRAATVALVRELAGALSERRMGPRTECRRPEGSGLEHTECRTPEGSGLEHIAPVETMASTSDDLPRIPLDDGTIRPQSCYGREPARTSQACPSLAPTRNRPSPCMPSRSPSGGASSSSPIQPAT